MLPEHQNPFQLLCDLDRKCRDRSGGIPAFQAEADGWTGVLFRIHDYELPVSMSEVREIVPLEALTTIPATANWLLGVMNLRGNLLPVIDLEGFLYGKNLPVTEPRCRLIVVEYAGSPVGLLVRAVLGMKHYRKDDAVPELPALDDKFAAFISRSYERQQSHYALFDMQRLLANDQFRSVGEK